MNLIQTYIIFKLKQFTYPLRPITTNTTCPSCITAIAGTGICQDFLLLNTVIIFFNWKNFTTRLPSSFIKHFWIKLLFIVQIFSTADLDKSLSLVSVLMWLQTLSDQLSILSLVSYYLTNNLNSIRLFNNKLFFFF